MQFGIFSVGDVTPDPTSGRTPSEAERIQAMVAIALKTEEVGLDVFATGAEDPIVELLPPDAFAALDLLEVRSFRLASASTGCRLVSGRMRGPWRPARPRRRSRSRR